MVGWPGGPRLHAGISLGAHARLDDLESAHGCARRIRVGLKARCTDHRSVAFMPVIAGVGATAPLKPPPSSFAIAWAARIYLGRKPSSQVLVNICIALAAGALIALAAVLWKGNPFLGLVLASAMILNLGLMAGFAGAVIPLLLKALKFDPALGSGIIVTGLTDAFGFLSFLGLATLFRVYLV
jgi:magnesium transporter